MQKIGLKDQPIENRDDEALGIGDYADVLTEFIENCDTPLTIALQGDWGTGKTSLMNLIKQSLKKQDAQFLTVWFNTWQYSQFNQSGSLALSMMSNLTSELSKAAKSSKYKEKIQSFTSGLQKLSHAVVVGGASFVGQGDLAKEFLGILGSSDTSIEGDQASLLAQIKLGMTECVKKVTDDQKGPSKIVVFVDDLDRLQPLTAVELLEAMKVFLDIDRCVFVLACDYSVVTTGLSQKFGLGKGQLKGKDFFDKIIQVPFKMPIRRYDPARYMRRVLESIGLKLTQQEVTAYQHLVEYSVEFNPRTIKRLFNTLQLLLILDSKNPPDPDINKKGTTDTSRVMFGILCMLEAYEPLYDQLIKNVSPEGLTELQRGLKDADDKDFKELREDLGQEQLERASKFWETFVDCIQLDDDKTVSDEEIGHLRDMMSYSALVSRGADLPEFNEDNFAYTMRSDLNRNYEAFVSDTGWPKYGKFRKTGNCVSLLLPHTRSACLSIRGDSTLFRFGLESEVEAEVYELGQIMCEHFGWNEGKTEELVDENEVKISRPFRYWFVETPRKSKDSLERFKEEVFQRCDVLTKPRTTLYDLCRKNKQTA